MSGLGLDWRRTGRLNLPHDRTDPGPLTVRRILQAPVSPYEPNLQANRSPGDLLKSALPERWMSGLSRTPGKRVYGESRTVGSNPTLSASQAPLTN